MSELNKSEQKLMNTIRNTTESKVHVISQEITKNINQYQENHPEIITGFQTMESKDNNPTFFGKLGPDWAGTYVGTKKASMLHVYLVHLRVKEPLISPCLNCGLSSECTDFCEGNTKPCNAQEPKEV